jgi:hypothetical protein
MTKTAVKDKNPGTSLRLCRIPISTPVKAAFSTTKLFNIADQTLKATGIAIDIRISNVIGLIIPFLVISFIKVVELLVKNWKRLLQ